MAARYGGQNMVDPIRRVVVRRPDAAFAVQDPKIWNYTATPDLEVALDEHDSLVEILRRAGSEVSYHEILQVEKADSIYVFDPTLLTNEGAVVLRMGKALRRGEEAALAATLAELEVPTLFSLEGHAMAEGGDLLWLDEATLFAGIGFRTNAEGVRQLRSGLKTLGVSVTAVDLPYFTGPDACLHLLSLISLVDHDLAVIYPPLLPVTLWQELKKRDCQVVEVPDSEFETMGTNVLALSPRNCVMLEGNPITQAHLEAAGCRVQTYKGQEISLKAEGGPTCLTRPILRSREVLMP